jgi:nucleoside-diphosphate-sugar epimerase
LRRLNDPSRRETRGHQRAVPDVTRLLVTGASGFLGRAVIAGLAGDGMTLRAAVRTAPVPPFAAGVEVVRHADLAEPIDWLPLLKDVDQVVHLAGNAGTDRSTDPDLYDRVNGAATAALAAAAARASVRQFVFVSSIRAQSGPSADHALTEADAAAPADAYGRSKLAAEAAVRTAGVPFTILRPVLLYGVGVKGNFARLLHLALSRWPLPAKDFINRRSLLAVDNFVSALRFVLAAPQAIGETYVVADPGIPPRLADVIATLRHAQGRWAWLLPLPTHYVETPLRMLGRDDAWERLGGNLRVDASKLITAGWQPLCDTREGLAALVAAGKARRRR